MKTKHIKYAVISFSIVGIALLYLISTISQPTAINLDELKNYEGRDVIVTGVVVDKYVSSGNTVLRVRDGNVTAPIFVREVVDAEVGDKIQAMGRVQIYNNEYEVIADEIDILERWKSSWITLNQLSSNPNKYEGFKVNVTGYVGFVSDNSFYLTDSSWNYSIKVVGKNLSPLKGQHIFIHGLFLYDHSSFRYTIWGENWGEIID